MRDSRSADVVIVGSGAGGGPLAYELARTGFSVLVLEKGPRWERGDYAHDEIRQGLQPDMFVPSVDSDPHVLVIGSGPDARIERTSLGWIASCVGGGTAHMGGAFFRFHPADFELQSRFGAFEEVRDWPYSYSDLEPYYTKAEWELGVSGDDGNTAHTGHRSRPYPMLPLPSHPIASLFRHACSVAGLHAIDTPRAINSRPFRGRPACSGCAFCGGYGCPTGARGSTHEALLGRAEATGRCTIHAHTMVHRVMVTPEGRASGCIYFDDHGVEHFARASLVCVCASAVESARLLLLSACPLFPDGLANGSGLVGRHLQFHAGSFGRGVFSRRLYDDNRTDYDVGSLLDYYFLPDDVSTFPKGGVHRFDVERTHPIADAQHIALRSGPNMLWGEALSRRLKQYFCDELRVSFEVFHDSIPNRDTYMSLDPDVRDQWGLPVARLHVHQAPHEQVSGSWLVVRGLEVLSAMGASSVECLDVARVSSAMVHGTCRAGSDPDRSVLDPYCRSHEVPNLFVVDGSFMPTSGGAPSTLTIIANSFRTAAYIIDRAHRHEL